MRAEDAVAARLDRAIDSLLRDEPFVIRADDEERLTETARRLRDLLPRFHPRFGFEERLSARLAAAGDPRAADEPIAFPAAVAARNAVIAEDRRRRRGLMAGGAIASGVSIALPIAGAALVAWRRSRSSKGLF